MREFLEHPDQEPEDAIDQFDCPELSEKKLQAQLIEDFRTSFYLSQGSQERQLGFIEAVALLYAAELTYNQQDHIIESFPHMRKRIERMSRLPSAHATRSEDLVNKTFRAEWMNFTRLLTATFEKEFPSEFELEQVWDLAAHNLMKQDIKYIDEGRPERTKGQDPYKSLFREHVLNLVTTGSGKFDELCQLLRTRWEVGRYNTHQLRALVIVWEERHPGYSFFEAPLEEI